MHTLLEIIKRTTEFLVGKGVESARLNAELLIGHALERKRMQLYMEFERPLTEAELEKIRPLIRRRAQREPLQYIIGETDFGGLRLKVDRRALIPRPETEFLIELLVVRYAGLEAPRRILDLGTGSGAIALALAVAFPLAEVVAVDASLAALSLAQENASKTGLADRVRIFQSDWYESVERSEFDLIVSNPPYLTEAETAQTALEVRGFEPRQALIAAEDGLADLAKILAGAPLYLSGSGVLALETGITQHEKIKVLATNAGFGRTEGQRDLAGRERFIFASRGGFNTSSLI